MCLVVTPAVESPIYIDVRRHQRVDRQTTESASAVQLAIIRRRWAPNRHVADHPGKGRTLQLHRHQDQQRQGRCRQAGGLTARSRQRAGRRHNRKVDRDQADLDLKILPVRDANGKEVAQITVTLNSIVAEQVTVPMENEKLIVVREPQAPAKNGAYHVQLMKGFAAIGYNGELVTVAGLKSDWHWGSLVYMRLHIMYIMLNRVFISDASPSPPIARQQQSKPDTRCELAHATNVKNPISSPDPI